MFNWFKRMSQPMEETRSRYKIKRSLKVNPDTGKEEPNKWYWTLQAENGKVIAVSEMYETKQAAMNGIESVMRFAPIALVEIEEG